MYRYSVRRAQTNNIVENKTSSAVVYRKSYATPMPHPHTYATPVPHIT